MNQTISLTIGGVGPFDGVTVVAGVLLSKCKSIARHRHEDGFVVVEDTTW